MPPILVQLLILAAMGGLAWVVARSVTTLLAPRAAALGLDGKVPRVGGIGLVVGLLVPIGLAQLLATPLHEWASISPDSIPPLRFAGFGTLLIAPFLIGWLDDRRLIPRMTTVVLLAVVAVGVACMDLGVRQLALPRLGPVDIPWAVGVALAAAWLFVIMLGVNFLDGLDGLAGRMATWVSIALLFCTVNALWSFDLALVTVAILGASHGFLALNLESGPRRVLLGNGGSFALGGALGGVLLLLVTNDLRYAGERPYYVNLLTAGIVLALPLYEFVRTMITRLVRKEPLLASAQDSLYHAHRRAVGGDDRVTLIFVEPFLITFAVLGAVATRFDNPSAPSSERMVLVLLLAATTCTFYRLKVRRAEHKAAGES